MGRIRQMISVQGRESWTLFDSGARNTYIVPDIATRLATTELPRPTYTKLGGETKTSSQAAVLVGEIAGKPFHVEAMVIDRIGMDEEGKAISADSESPAPESSRGIQYPVPAAEYLRRRRTCSFQDP